LSGFVSLSLREPYDDFLTALHTGFKLTVAEDLVGIGPVPVTRSMVLFRNTPLPNALSPPIVTFQCLGPRTDGIVGLHVGQVKPRRLGSRVRRTTENNNIPPQ